MKALSRCRVCRDKCSDHAKLFDDILGFICPDCHEFLTAADKPLRRVGIEGVVLKPVRYKPEKQS